MQNEMEIKENIIYNEDCLKYMEMLKEQNIKVDCIILDPPYFNVVNEKWDKEWKSLKDYLDWIEKIFEKCNAVSKYNCNLWLFGFPYQLSYLIPIAEKNGFTYRQHITIDKGLQSVAGRTSDKLKMFPTSTEYVIMGKQKIKDMIETEKNVIDNSKMSPFTKSKHYRKLASNLYYKKSFEKGLHFHRLCIHNMELCYGNTHPNVLHETSVYIKRLEEGSKINDARKALKL